MLVMALGGIFPKVLHRTVSGIDYTDCNTLVYTGLASLTSERSFSLIGTNRMHRCSQEGTDVSCSQSTDIHDMSSRAEWPALLTSCLN